MCVCAASFPSSIPPLIFKPIVQFLLSSPGVRYPQAANEVMKCQQPRKPNCRGDCHHKTAAPEGLHGISLATAVSSAAAGIRAPSDRDPWETRLPYLL